MVAVLLAALFGVLPVAQADPPADFALRLTHQSCLGEIMDTFDRRFTREYSGGKHASTRLKLTRADHQKLYRLIQSAGFFDLPTSLAATYELTEPGGFTELTVRSGGTTHTVTLRLSAAIDDPPDVTAFRRLVAAIEDVFQHRPEVKRLPFYKHLCM